MKFIIFTSVALIFYTVLLWIDANNSSGGVGEKLRFDWISAVYSLGAMIGSIYLGLVATIQGERANEQNARLSKINEKQLENAILSQGHPLARFSKIQRRDQETNIFHIRLIDVNGVTWRKALTRNIYLQPLSEKYREDSNAQKIKLLDGEIESNLQLTYLHEDIDKGLYMIDVKMKKQHLETHRYYRLEFETDIISTMGVVLRCNCYALLDTEFEYNGRKDREYFEVYHQFLEIKEILSEVKYNGQKKA